MRVLNHKRAVEDEPEVLTQEEFKALHASLTETLDDDDVNDTSGE